MIRPTAAAAVLGLLFALPASAQRAPQDEARPTPQLTDGDERLDATLWVQRSVEFAQVARQAYQLAEIRLPQALAQPGSAALEQADGGAGKPPAVIFDVDETVLDNSPFEAWMIQRGRPGFDQKLWDEWLTTRRARATPGAVAFVAALREAGVTPLFVTNRECEPRPGADVPCPQEADTLANMKAVGFGDIPPEHMMLKNEQPDWPSDKGTRRAKAAADYRIVMAVGDQFSDMISVTRKDDTDRRAELMAEHQAQFDLRWVVLPNPMYGAWLDVLPKPRTESLLP